jgi:hypothetical protein
MVDLLGRADHIQKACDVMKSMMIGTIVFTCRALLSVCQAYGLVVFSHQILMHELEFSGSGVYVLLSNVYAVKDRMTDVSKVRGRMSE